MTGSQPTSVAVRVAVRSSVEARVAKRTSHVSRVGLIQQGINSNDNLRKCLIPILRQRMRPDHILLLTGQELRTSESNGIYYTKKLKNKMRGTIATHREGQGQRDSPLLVLVRGVAREHLHQPLVRAEARSGRIAWPRDPFEGGRRDMYQTVTTAILMPESIWKYSGCAPQSA